MKARNSCLKIARYCPCIKYYHHVPAVSFHYTLCACVTKTIRCAIKNDDNIHSPVLHRGSLFCIVMKHYMDGRLRNPAVDRTSSVGVNRSSEVDDKGRYEEKKNTGRHPFFGGFLARGTGIRPRRVTGYRLYVYL